MAGDGGLYIKIGTLKLKQKWNKWSIYPIKSTILWTSVATSFSSGDAVAKHWSTVASAFNNVVAKGSGNE